MITLRQLSIHGRKKKKRRCTVAALKGSPQRKGIVMKILITTPRKPNSAKRRYAKVRVMASKKIIFAHPPGIGPTYLNEYSVVMVEGGSPPDTPGINYSLIRGVYDFCISEEYGRRNRRSKFGMKKPNILFHAIRSLKDSIELPKNITLIYREPEKTESYLKKLNALTAYKEKIKANLIKYKVNQFRFMQHIRTRGRVIKKKKYFHHHKKRLSGKDLARILIRNFYRQKRLAKLHRFKINFYKRLDKRFKNNLEEFRRYMDNPIVKNWYIDRRLNNQIEKLFFNTELEQQKKNEKKK